jgi:hypothetical protein
MEVSAMAQTQTVGSHRTTISTQDGTTSVVYHSTPVVSFNSDTITLRTGGYCTATTKTRMNQTANQFGLGYTVYQRDYEWFVRYNGDDHMMTSQMMEIDRNTGEVIAL